MIRKSTSLITWTGWVPAGREMMPFGCTRSDEHRKAFKDPLHVPVEPITKARSKKIKEALNGLIQEI